MVLSTKQPNAPDVFVKGGTTTAAYDKQLAQKRHETEHRRAYQDRMRAVTKAHPNNAMLRTHRLGGRGSHATIILAVRHPKDLDPGPKEWQTCELSQEGNDLVLILVCMRCLYKLKRPMGECQMTIRSSHRAFTFTPAKRSGGSVSGLPKWAKGNDIWVNPMDRNEVLTIPGSITMHGPAKCDNLGCGWEFIIDDSELRPYR